MQGDEGWSDRGGGWLGVQTMATLELHEYQKEGIRCMLRRIQSGQSTLLADESGLGKTPSAPPAQKRIYRARACQLGGGRRTVSDCVLCACVRVCVSNDFYLHSFSTLKSRRLALLGWGDCVAASSSA